MSDGSCPNGGNWYACTDQTAFLGCCESDPCNGSGCPWSDLQAAGVGSGSDPDSTSDSGSEAAICTVGQWWTCPDQVPSFQGCCLTNPCLGDYTGCPAGDLYPAAVASATAAATSSRISSSKAASSSPSHVSSKVTTATSSATSSSRTTSSSPSSTATFPANLTLSTTSSSSASLTKTQVHAIAGASAAAAVCIFLLFALCITWYRAKKSRKAHHSQPPLRPAPSPIQPEKSEARQNDPRTALPYLQTNLGQMTPVKRTFSTYSAYSPDLITPSSFDSQNSAENLVGSERPERNSTGDVYYPGRPKFGIPHAIKRPESVAQPGSRRWTMGADPQGSSPPPAYNSSSQSSISPIERARRASCNYSSPMQEAGNSPDAAAGAKISQRRSAGPQYENHLRPPAIRQVQSDRGLGGHDPRRTDAPVESQFMHETPDRVPELPNLRHAQTLRHDRRWQNGDAERRARTMSVSAVHGNAGWGMNRANAAVRDTVGSVDTRGWGGDMRSDREKARDCLREKERVREKERERERQRMARMSDTTWQQRNS